MKGILLIIGFYIFLIVAYPIMINTLAEDQRSYEIIYEYTNISEIDLTELQEYLGSQTNITNLTEKEILEIINNIDDCITVACVKVGFHDSVDVSVKKNRWYGTIYEESNELGVQSNLYLFDLIKFPIKVNGNSWVNIHIVFLIGLIVFGISILITKAINRANKNERGYEEEWYQVT